MLTGPCGCYPGLSRRRDVQCNSGGKTGQRGLTGKLLPPCRRQESGIGYQSNGCGQPGISFIDILAATEDTKMVALYGPEHGIDGTAKAGAWVESYIHPRFGIPVYSLYGSTRIPTQAMLQGIDVLLFDIQDIGARTYTYMSTLQYCLVAVEKYNKPLIILDRPNPWEG